MALDPAAADGLEDDTVADYEAAEAYLIGVIAAGIARVGKAPNWAEAQLLELQRIRPQVVGMANALQARVPNAVGEATEEAYRRGRTAAEIELADAREMGAPIADASPIANIDVAGAGSEATESRPVKSPDRTHSRSTSGAARSTANAAVRKAPAITPNRNNGRLKALHAAERAARDLTRMNAGIDAASRDIWHRIISSASARVQSGDDTVWQALQKAMDAEAREGFSFFRDKSGRRWHLDTYSEMSIRTATNTALMEGHNDGLVDAGIDLVIVSSHSNPAPQCAPYERRVLSLTGATPRGTTRMGDNIVTVKATLNEALAHGYRHPNCRHSHAAYIPGFTKAAPPPLDETHAGYKATQKQRYLERQIRQSRRMEAAALDQEGKKAAVARRRAYEQRLAAHIKEHDLPRRRHREKLRQPGNHMPVA